jgi:hypothetical protein
MIKNNYISDCLKMLTEMTVPYFITRKLEAHFYPEWPSLRINTTNDIVHFKNMIIEYYGNYENIAAPIDPNFDVEDLKMSINANENYKITDNDVDRLSFDDDVNEVVMYFKQGLEMYQTSLSMSEFTSPLLEYYALVQCVKGLFRLQFNLPSKSQLFNGHGLGHKNMQAKVHKHGVFHALNIISSRGGDIKEDFLNKYKEGTMTDKLENCLKKSISTHYGNNQMPQSSLSYCFTASFILSSLVRYNPRKWQEIITGEESELILNIRNFRSNDFPNALRTLLSKFTSIPSMYISTF